MHTSLRVISNSPITPVSVQEMKNHLRITQNDFDETLQDYLWVATNKVENILNRALLTTSYQFVLAQRSLPFPIANIAIIPLSFTAIHPLMRSVELPRSNNASITNVLYHYTTGSLHAETKWHINSYIEPAHLTFDDYEMWSINMDSVIINYQAGYGDTPASIPNPIRHAIKLYTGLLYSKTGDEADVDTSKEHRRFMSLLSDYRLFSFGEALGI